MEHAYVLGLIAASVALGVVLLVLNGPFSSIRNLLLVMFVTQVLPLVIAVLVYSRIYSAATAVELLGIAIWGYIGISIAGVFGYFAFAGMSSGYPGPTQERVNDITRFLVTPLSSAVSTQLPPPYEIDHY